MGLNQKYGFKKFVIVVPSLVIKEGVYHSLKARKSHMDSLFSNEVYDYFVYDSDHLDKELRLNKREIRLIIGWALI